MAIDSLAAVPVVASSFDSSLLELKLTLQNESATANLISDAVKHVQATEPSGDRQGPGLLLDIFV